MYIPCLLFPAGARTSRFGAKPPAPQYYEVAMTSRDVPSTLIIIHSEEEKNYDKSKIKAWLFLSPEEA